MPGFKARCWFRTIAALQKYGGGRGDTTQPSYICTSMHTFMYLMYACTYVCIYVCIYVMYVCMYVCVYVGMYVGMCVMYACRNLLLYYDVRYSSVMYRNVACKCSVAKRI